MLTLEFFADGSDDCPLFLLHGRDPAAIQMLASRLSAPSFAPFDLQVVPGIQVVPGLHLIARVARSDVGLRQLGPSDFSWDLTHNGWEQVAGLLEPFGEVAARDFHQWLQTGALSFVVSTSRHW